MMVHRLFVSSIPHLTNYRQHMDLALPRISRQRGQTHVTLLTPIFAHSTHFVTTPHNYGRILSPPAPGFVMGVGSIGESLLPYEEGDTFISTDASVTWQMA